MAANGALANVVVVTCPVVVLVGESRRRRRLRLDFLLASSGIDLQKLNDQLLKMINPTLKGWQV